MTNYYNFDKPLAPRKKEDSPSLKDDYKNKSYSLSLLVSKHPIDKTKTLKLLLAKLHEKMKHESRPHSSNTDYEEIVKEEIFRLANDNQELWDKDDPT